MTLARFRPVGLAALLAFVAHAAAFAVALA